MNASAKSDYRRIPAIVSELRAVALGRLRHEGLAAAIAVTGLSLLLAVSLFALVPPLWWLRLAVVALWAVAVGVVVVWRWLTPARQYRELTAIANLIETRFPDFRNDITASLQFVGELETLRREGKVSVSLVEKVLQQTRDRLDANRALLPRAVPEAKIKIPYGALAGALLAILIMSFAAPDAFQRGVRGFFLGPAPMSADASIERAPIVGDIVLRLRFPDYTGLGERTIEGSTGEIEALRGTQIEFQGVALKPVEKAEIIFTPEESGGEDDAKGPQRLLLQRRPGGKLVANFPALRSGSYTIGATLTDGRDVADGIDRPVRILRDESPKLTVLSPTGEVDVTPEDVVTFAFEASDDFGLTELAIVTAFAGQESEKKRTVIKTFGAEADILPGDARPTDGADGPLMQHRGETMLDLMPFGLKPKDRIVVSIEAVDNDSTEGPKVTTSAPIVLRVSSPEDKHLEIIADQEALFEALLDVLGDYLEKPIGSNFTNVRGESKMGVPPEWTSATLTERFGVAVPPHRKKATILTTMVALKARMETDPLMLKRDYELFQRTHADLANLHAAEKGLIDRMTPASGKGSLTASQLQRLFDAREGTVKGTERAIITLEDLIAAQRMENALETAKDLKDAVERLKELMEKYKETQDPAVKAEIMREMQRLRERMREMMAKMQQQIKKLPQEHVNMEALDKEGMMNKASDAKNSLEEMMKALESGDIDKAMAMLDEMTQSVDDMMAQMETDFDEMQPEGLSELDKKVSEVMDEINNLQAQEQELAKETSELNREMAEQQREELDKMIDEFTEKQLEKVEDLEKRLKNIDSNPLDGMDRNQVERLKKNAERLKKALQQKDMAQALEEANELERDMQQADTSLDFRSRYMPPNNPRKKGYQKARRGVQGAKPQAKEIARDLQQMLEQARPRPSTEQSQRMSQLKQRQEQVRERTEALKEGLDPEGKFPMLQEEVGPGLEEAGQYMEGAEKRLGKREGRPAHQNQKLAGEKLGDTRQKLKKALQQERMGQQQGRGRQVSKEKVKIPGEGAQAPKEFREDIMDAMKEGSLESYEDELQQYYESLVR